MNEKKISFKLESNKKLLSSWACVSETCALPNKSDDMSYWHLNAKGLKDRIQKTCRDIKKNHFFTKFDLLKFDQFFEIQTKYFQNRFQNESISLVFAELQEDVFDSLYIALFHWSESHHSDDIQVSAETAKAFRMLKTRGNLRK